MNRVEQIEKAASVYENDVMRIGFECGAEWADSHPQTIDVTEFSKQIPPDIQEVINDHYLEMLDEPAVDIPQKDDGVEMWVARDEVYLKDDENDMGLHLFSEKPIRHKTWGDL